MVIFECCKTEDDENIVKIRKQLYIVKIRRILAKLENISKIRKT